MRIVLEKDKQNELFKLAKSNFTWAQLSRILELNEHYVGYTLFHEHQYISEEVYKKLCDIVRVNFDKFIIKRLDNNWGRVKGGKNSKGNTKSFIEPEESEELAELFGIILGDGHVEETKIGTRIRVYCIDISGDFRKDKIYLENYVSNLLNRLFGEGGRIKVPKTTNGIHLVIYGKKIIEFVKKKGINSGNKKVNHQKIPDWILENKGYLAACLRGLIDTDGCIYYISKKTNKNLRISFTSYIPALMNDVRTSLIGLGFHPSKVMRGEDICISSKEDVDKFLKEIGFSNDKHLKRL